MTEVAICSPGVCAGMGTANSMHIVTEALGMALPGSTPIRANSQRMFDYVEQAGQRIVEMVWEDLKPRDIITDGAIRNAAAVTLALSGSINCVKHLAAIADEAGLATDVYDVFSELSDKIPLLMAIRPSGDSLIEDLEDAGGARAVMKRLEGFLDLERTDGERPDGGPVDQRRQHPGRQPAAHASKTRSPTGPRSSSCAARCCPAAASCAWAASASA